MMGLRLSRLAEILLNMHAALEPLRGKISVLRVYETGADFPDPYTMALVVVERRWWYPWNRSFPVQQSNTGIGKN